MLKSHRPFPNKRPLSRLQIVPQPIKKVKKGVIPRIRPESLNNPCKRLKFFDKSPTKQNDRPRANAMKQKLVKAAPGSKIQLPIIQNKKKLSEQPVNRNKNTQDFETYCARGHTVFVDQRDAGVKLGHLKQNTDERYRKSMEHKNYLGETAYVPFNIQDLRKKCQLTSRKLIDLPDFLFTALFL